MRFLLAVLLTACGADMSAAPCDQVAERDGGDMSDGEVRLAKQVKLGNSLELRNDELINGATETQPRTLLDVNPNKYQAGRVLEAGAWVVTIQTFVQEPAAIPGINPLLVQVEYGAGGASARLELSCAPGCVFQTSSDQIRVSVLLEDLINTAAPGGGVPNQQLVAAQLRRGYAVTRPTRTFYFASLLGLATVTRDLPPQSVSAYVHADPAFGAYAADTILDILGGGLIVAQYLGTDLRTAQLAGVPLPVPVGASAWRMTAGAAGIPFPFTVEFQLDL